MSYTKEVKSCGKIAMYTKEKDHRVFMISPVNRLDVLSEKERVAYLDKVFEPLPSIMLQSIV